jgi:hypothetical protein
MITTNERCYFRGCTNSVLAECSFRCGRVGCSEHIIIVPIDRAQEGNVITLKSEYLCFACSVKLEAEAENDEE